MAVSLFQYCWCSIIGAPVTCQMLRIHINCTYKSFVALQIFLFDKSSDTANHFMQYVNRTCLKMERNGTEQTGRGMVYSFHPSKTKWNKSLTLALNIVTLYYTYLKTNHRDPSAAQSFWCWEVDQTKAPEGITSNWWLHTVTAGQFDRHKHTTRHYCAPNVK